MPRGQLGIPSRQKVFQQLGQGFCLIVMQHVPCILQGGHFQIGHRFQTFMELIKREFAFPPL